MFKLGLIINPLAGIGGPLGLKGSDGDEVASIAINSGAVSQAANRCRVTLEVLADYFDQMDVYCFDGNMGATVVRELGISVEIVGSTPPRSSGADTIAAAKILKQRAVDIIVFVGGDGTARDIFNAVGDDFPVLGIPSGVKMHSGVYAVSPSAAGEILLSLLSGKLTDIGLAEVRDIDEQAFREGRVKAQYYGELLVPREGHFLQQVKSSGREVEELVLQDIGADIVESLDDNCLYLIGPGTTPRAIMDELDLENTLLGVDAIMNGELLALDLNEREILNLLEEMPGPAKIVITAIGGQGHILGRGNQQLSPAVIRRVGINNIIIVATKTKITELQGRPLLVDSNDAKLDRQMSGFRKIVTGYHDTIIYPLGQHTTHRDGEENL